MTALSIALLALACGAAGAIALARRPHASLFVSLASIGVAGPACVVGALPALLATPCPSAHAVSWRFPIGSASLAIDGLSAWFLLVIGIVSVAVALYSWDYFRGSVERQPTWAVGALLNALVAAMVISVCAADVILFMFGWEVMSLSAFLLVGLHHRDAHTRRGAWMYLIATHLGTALGVLPAFGALAARAGSTSFAAFSGIIGPAETTVCVTLFFLGLLGFGTKAGIMPMHVWLPEAHPVAPSPVSALMSGVVIKTGVYGFIRLTTWLPPLPRACAVVVVVLGVITGVMGILYALTQRRYKRMLAYSSVENIGIITLGIGLGLLGRTTHQPLLAALGFGGALLHILNHALFKGLLFLSAGAVLHGTGIDDLERLGGLARRDPLNAGLFAFGCAAICGLPPLNGFVGEFLIYSGFLRGAQLNSALVTAVTLLGLTGLALIGGLSLSAFTRLFGIMFLGEPRDERVVVHPTPASMLGGMTILAAACVVVVAVAPLVGGLLQMPLGTLYGQAVDARAFSDSILSPLAWVATTSLAAIGIVGALIALRRRVRSRHPAVEHQVTWGCGFALPTARMQYTGSSFVANLVDAFRGLLRTRRHLTRPDGYFAASSRLETQTADAAVQLGFEPAFRAIARGCARLWPLQHGRIQLYLIYIVATLLLVFAVEAWLSPFATRHPGASRVQPVIGSSAHGGACRP